MKLSSKFILASTILILVISSVFAFFLYAAGLSVIAEDIVVRSGTVWHSVEGNVEKENAKEVQKVLGELKQKELDIAKFDIYKLGDAPVIVASIDQANTGKAAEGTTIESLNVTKTGEMVQELNGDGFDMVLPMKSADGQIAYAVDVRFTLEKSMATLNTILKNVAVTAVVFLLIGIATLWFMVNRILKRPLERLMAAANKIASGDLNIQLGKELKSKDEVGHLSRAFVGMTENLKHLIGKITDSAQQVAASAEQLTAGAEQTSQATEHIVDTVQEVAVGSEKQVSYVEESAKVIQEMSTGVRKISDNAQFVSTTTMQASQVASEGNLAIQTVMKQMNSINNTVHDLHDMIRRLGERSQEIGQIVQVITGIAEQTNLLALNAAIEAARAGENGRGFSVVADEVRKLAVQSATSGQQITQLVETIQEETNIAIQSMETGTREVAEGISVVNIAGESFVRIQDSINEVVEQIHSVSAAVQQMTAGAERVVESIKLIANVAEETAGNTQLVSASTEEQLASMNEIADSSLALNDMAEELQSLVNNFKM